MHKGVILLTKASDREEALNKVVEFLEPYGDGDVWDWYQIGGRWQNTLAPAELKKQWYEKIKTYLKMDEWGVSTQEIKKHATKLQKDWEELGLHGTNPYADHYSLGGDGNYYDAVPLVYCIDTVKEWVKDVDSEKAEIWEKMTVAKAEAADGKYDMTGYYAGIYRDLSYGNFSFECNVFDIDGYDAESIPIDVDGWWAVMVDMHN